MWSIFCIYTVLLVQDSKYPAFVWITNHCVMYWNKRTKTSKTNSNITQFSFMLIPLLYCQSTRELSQIKLYRLLYMRYIHDVRLKILFLMLRAYTFSDIFCKCIIYQKRGTKGLYEGRTFFPHTFEDSGNVSSFNHLSSIIFPSSFCSLFWLTEYLLSVVHPRLHPRLHLRHTSPPTPPAYIPA